jgi:hypothetical protein
MKNTDTRTTRQAWLVALACAIVGGAALLAPRSPAPAYIEAAYTLGRIATESTNIVLIRVEKIDRQKNLIVYHKVKDLKGTNPGEQIKHNIGTAGFEPREWQGIMAWAEIGRTALMFSNGAQAEICIDNYWYQVNAGEWWALNHGEPYLLRSFCGKPEKLAAAVTLMLTGQEVVLPCMVDGDKAALKSRNAKVQRVKASLKLMDYNPPRDFVGWGGDDLRALEGMPAFMQCGDLANIGPGAAGIAWADFDNTGRPGFCLFGEAKVALMQNAGGSFNDVPLPVDGAHSAAWGDFDGDGRLDLLLATPTGPRLFRNAGKQFKDATDLLPRQPYYDLPAVAWIDTDGKGRRDILLADGFRGLRLYRNRTGDPTTRQAAEAGKGVPLFEDISDQVGLGENGAAGKARGDYLLVADVNGDGRPDILLCAGSGLLILNTPNGFVEAKDSGLSFQTGGVKPVFGDFLGDKTLGLFVPQKGKSRLFKNDGHGRFTDVTDRAGDLAKFSAEATCAVWADFNNRGRADLLVGCFKEPNRYFRNDGGGKFTDCSGELGIDRRVFNTVGIAAVDLTKDNVQDVIFVNEGQESGVFIGDPARIQRAAGK